MNVPYVLILALVDPTLFLSLPIFIKWIYKDSVPGEYRRSEWSKHAQVRPRVDPGRSVDIL